MTAHNTEEALFLPRYLAVIRGRAPSWWVDLTRQLTAEQMGLALALVTLAAVVPGIWLWRRPDSRGATWTLLLVQATLLLNALWHVSAAVLVGGYAPGLLTAVGLNLPLAVYLLRRARREGWVSPRALLGLLPGALVLHGPLLLGVLRLSQWRSG